MTPAAVIVPDGVRILGPMEAGFREILTHDALAFVASLARSHQGRVQELLALRCEEQQRYDGGQKPHFLAETSDIRAKDWTVAPIPDDLQDRRVEITGPADRKMVINALNSGAKVFMADFEDANSPTWQNMVQGQINLRNAVRRQISHDDPATKKHYELNPETAVLMVRPRGWHLWERHVSIDGHPAPAGLVDFGLYFFHNAAALRERGTGPYFYLPKTQSHLEARLWNEVFLQAQEALGVPRGSIRATVLIETLPASFVMDEILWELREHSAGLNCGRWDYIFSFIKTFRAHREFLLPDRSQLTMEQPFMRAYTQLVIKTCHRRNIHAMGGMAAQIPIANDEEKNRIALEKVRADKLREVKDGHDGTWVAHPGLVPLAKEVFDQYMPTPNQIHRKREDVDVTEANLIEVPTGKRTEADLRHNIDVGIQYLASWLGGSGCVPIYHLMEDAATSEISRAQVWQCLHHGARLEDGRTVDEALFRRLLDEEMTKLRAMVGRERFEAGHYYRARELFAALSTADMPEDFLTLPAYEYLLTLTEEA